MNFGALMQTSKKLQETNKKDVRTYCTKIDHPKKEKKKDLTFTNNIKKILARKEAEQKAKAMMAKKKRDDRLALKASSNMMKTKDCVKTALEKEKEEALLPYKRKRKRKDSTGSEQEKAKSDSRVEKKHQPAKKPKISAPPPLSFSELLKIAAKNQQELIVIKVKTKDEKVPLLTKKQKLELEKRKQWKERKTREDQLNRIPKLKTTPSVSKSVLNDISNVKLKPTNEALKKPSTSQESKSIKSCDLLKSNPETSKKPTNNCDSRNVKGIIKKAPDLKFGQPKSKDARIIAINARSKELAHQAAKNQLKPRPFPPAELKAQTVSTKGCKI